MTTPTTNWQLRRLGRVHDPEAGVCKCTGHDHPGVYRAEWVHRETAELSTRYYCGNRAAMFAGQFGITFPPGYFPKDEESAPLAQPSPEPADPGKRPPKLYEIPPETPIAACASCGAVIFWIRTELGKPMPVRPDGTSHFIDCANSKSHRKAR